MQSQNRQSQHEVRDCRFYKQEEFPAFSYDRIKAWNSFHVGNDNSAS